MAVAQNEAGSLTLVEEGGGTLKLTQRALPYMPLAISGKQRAEFHWYPGNPQATVQMLGPEEQTITLKGFWKDKFIQGTSAAQFITAQVLTPTAATTASAVPDVAALVKIVDNMRRMGRRIQLQWDKLIRYGHIIGFTQTWHTPHYCEWELEFAVAALEEPRVVSSNATQPTLADAAVQASEWVNGNTAAKEEYKPAVTVLAPSFQKLLTDFDNECFKTSNWLSGGATLIAQGTALSSSVARSGMAALNVLTTTAQAYGNALDGALTEWFNIGTFVGAVSTGSIFALGESDQVREDALPFGVQLGATSYQRNVRQQVRSIAYSTAVTRWSIQRQLQDELKASFTAKQDMDLRDVSTQFYGTPDGWRDLLIYNGLTSSRLTAGQLIWVPQQGYSAGAGLTSGGGY